MTPTEQQIKQFIIKLEAIFNDEELANFIKSSQKFIQQLTTGTLDLSINNTELEYV